MENEKSWLELQMAQLNGSSRRGTCLVGWARNLLFVSVFAAGFTITGIEIALGRLLAPHFGASLTVWAAIIAAVIGALSIGYPLGGALADRRPDPALPLTAMLLGGLLGAGLGVIVPLWLGPAMAGVGLSGPAFWVRLSAVLLMFAVPCIMLAIVTPAALRVTVRGRSTIGRDAGWLYALGSLGSVLGILLPALWWIPLLGLRTTFLLLGAVSGVPAAIGLAIGMAGASRRSLSALLLLLAALPLIPEAVWIEAGEGRRVLYDKDSGIQRIRIVEIATAKQRQRLLQLNEGWSIHSKLITPHYATGGVWDWMALTALLPDPEDGRTDVLIVGLAGGTVSTLMTRLLRPLLPDLAITGIELDPEVLHVADRYLEMDRSHLEAIAADGRIWLRASDSEFDLIILDAYRQPSIPAHLSSVEFFNEVKEHLAPGGLAVLNVFAPAGRSRILDGLSATWTAVFPEAQILEGPKVNRFASHLLFGGPAGPVAFSQRELGRLPRQLQPAWLLMDRNTRILPPLPHLRPWTDDWAPVELLTDRAFRDLRPANPELALPR